MPPDPSAALCPTCRDPIARDAPFGQCPRCLLGFASGTGLDHDFPEEEIFDGGQSRTFAGYELIEPLARGGMGVVYRARQTGLGREVALKMLVAGELSAPDAVERFRNEASAAASLEHPHIVPVYEIGEEPTGPYFSMRLVPGRRNVSDWARGLSAAERPRLVARMMAKIARAVAYAHERGVLHRDLKPSNLLIDDEDEPQVTDFGLARLYREVDSGLTLTRQILGSPSYMAPEQAEGRRADETTLTDVYGLGAVLYELISGRPPFVAESPFATARMVVEEAPARLAGVPRDLETLCLKCLEKEHGRRYGSAAELAEDLERFARGEPIRARPLTTPEALWRWARRRPKVAALFGTLLLTFFAGFGGVFWQWRRAEEARATGLQANAALRESVSQLEWRRTVLLLDSGDYSTGMAQLARLLRADPENPRAASLAISVLEQRGFATPAAPSLSHGSEFFITQARLSADGSRIVTAGSDGTARFWDAATSAPLGEVMRHGGPVRWVEYSADGRRVATASDDRSARIWDAQTGAPLSPPLEHESGVLMLDFGGVRLATLSVDGTARLWQEGRLEQALPLGGAGVALAWNAAGDRLFTASTAGVKGWGIDGRLLYDRPIAGIAGMSLSPDETRLAVRTGKDVRMIDAITGEESGVIFEEMGGLLAFAWSPDSTRIAGGAHGNWARVWDVATGRALTPKLPHLYACSSVVFSPDGRTLITGGHDGTTRRWEIATAEPAAAPLMHRDAVKGSHISPDGSHLLVVTHPWSARVVPRGGTTQLWDLRRHGARPWRFSSDGGSASTVAWSSDGKAWATTSFNGALVVHELGKESTVFPGSKVEGWTRGVAFLPGDQQVYRVTNSGEIAVWSRETGGRISPPMQTESAIENSRLFPDSRRLLVGEASGAVSIWELVTGEVLLPLTPHRAAPVNGVAVSPDGLSVATSGEDGRALVSDAATGSLLYPPLQLDDEIVSIQYSRDGRWIIAGSHDHTARIWDARTGAPRCPPLQVDGEVAYAEFSPDGSRALTADRAGTVRIWDPATGKPLTDSLRHSSALRGASFSPDGTRIVTEDHHGLRLWETASGEPLTLLQPHRTGIGIGFDTEGMHVLFSPDGCSVLHGTASADSLRWDFPAPPLPVPAWLPDLLESIATLSVSDTTAIAPVAPESWFLLQETLRGLPGDDFYSRWARNYCEVTVD